MAGNHDEWTRARNDLVRSMKALGFTEELGDVIARNLGSPKAMGVARAPRSQAHRAPRTEMERMTSYLQYVKPRSEQLVVDEMLAICSEIAAWRDASRT